MVLPASITIRHKVTGANLKTIEYTPLTHSFPDNVSGRSCVLECNAFVLEPTTPPENSTSTDTYILTCSWTSPCSRIYSDTSVIVGRAVIACMFNNQCYSCGPVVVNVPEGPNEMTFTVSRTDGGDLCGATSGAVYLFANMTITPNE